MEVSDFNSYTSKQYYEIGNSFYYGNKHFFNPPGICDLISASKFYKLAYETLKKGK